MIKTSVPLADAVGKHISHFCPFDLSTQNQKNHCAHLVSHLLGYEFGTTCKNQTWDEKQRPEKGAAIRVNELFNRLSDRGVWSNRPAHLCACLIFVTNGSNVRSVGYQLEMQRSPSKHVGIFLNGTVWHYSNGGDAVVSDTELGFMTKFNASYRRSGDTVEYYYGAFL